MHSAILTNSTELVSAVATEYVRCYERELSISVPRDPGSIESPVEFIIEAIEKDCSRSLHSLLSIGIFRENINSRSRTGTTPLEAAVKNFRKIPHRNNVSQNNVPQNKLNSLHIEVLRTVIIKGANILQKLQTSQELSSVTNMPYRGFSNNSMINEKNNSRNQHQNNIENENIIQRIGYPDNIFALAAMCGSVEAIRLLLFSCPTPTAVCVLRSMKIKNMQHSLLSSVYIPTSFSKSPLVTATTAAATSFTSSSFMAGNNQNEYKNENGSGTGFYFGIALFHSNPLLYAAAVGDADCLSYLLTTAFSSLNNYISHNSSPNSIQTNEQEKTKTKAIESYGECTPLSIAVLTSNTDVIHLLMAHNTNIFTRLRAPVGGTDSTIDLATDFGGCVGCLEDALYSTILCQQVIVRESEEQGQGDALSDRVRKSNSITKEVEVRAEHLFE